MSTTVLLALTLGASGLGGGGAVTFQIYWPPGPVEGCMVMVFLDLKIK